MNPSVTGYIRKHKQWQQELDALRALVLDSPLVEEVKWRVPCYTLQGNNVIIVSAFKEYCAISFLKGVLLKDEQDVLSPPGENTQSARLIRFTNAEEIAEMEAILRDYIQEAIEVEKSGLKVEFKKVAEFSLPEELQSKFDEVPELKTAFEALTPGRQRAYLLHFSAPKQSKTRVARIEKWMQPIFEGKGLNDD